MFEKVNPVHLVPGSSVSSMFEKVNPVHLVPGSSDPPMLINSKPYLCPADYPFRNKRLDLMPLYCLCPHAKSSKLLVHAVWIGKS